MRQKFGVAILAAVMALAGTREAFRQFDELKTSVGDWTRTSILGNLLVSAAGTTEEDASAQASQPPTILLAQTRLACEGERLRSATQASRPASKTKAANSGHAKMNEKFDSVHGIGELSLRFVATPRELHRIEVKTRGQSFVAVAPQLAELAKTWGASVEPKAVEQAVRAREGVEAGAGRARVAAEWKKLGLHKVFVRVAREGGASEEKNVLTFEPRAFATGFDLRSLAGLDETTGASVATVTMDATAQDKVSCDSLSKDNSSGDASSSAPAQGFDSNSIFNNPATTFSLNCDSDPLG